MIDFQIKEICPRCHRQTMLRARIEPHPTRNDIAIHTFHCVDCGPVKTVTVDLTLPAKPGGTKP